MRKYTSIFFLIKLLLIDIVFISHAIAQTPVAVKSYPVSYKISSLADPITVISNPVSYSLGLTANHVSLTSASVSFNTSLLPTAFSISSLPVSYVISMESNLITLNSEPVSYSLSEFVGMNIEVSSDSVSYKTYNGTPILSKVIPNVLPIKSDLTTYKIKLKGENFSMDAVASIGTLKIDSEYVSSKEIIATIPGSFTNNENIFEIFVINPTPDGSVSEGLNVSVVDPVPTVKIVANPSIGIAPQVVTFDGRESEDILASFFGTMTIYLWNFGDNNADAENPNTLDDPVVTHKYTVPGKYQVMLSVTNSYGMTSNLTREVEVRDKNDPPNGTISASVSGGDIPVSISFNSMITDPESDTISYLWDFGDGSTSTEVNPNHIYEIAGIYTPKLTVIDTVGAKTVLNTNVIKALPPNNVPVVQVAAIPKNSTLKQNSNGQFIGAVQFASEGTYDPDAEPLTFKWDFGDGETSTEENPKHEYLMSGNYDVKLIVSDERDAKVESVISVSVLKPNPNPVAVLSQASGIAPFEVVFDGMASQDYNGMPVSLKWDFGDGTSETVISSSDPIKHIYQNPGVYLVTLIATAADNRFKRINPGNIVVNDSNAPVGQILKLEGDSKGILGTAMVKLSAMGSFDPDGGAIDYKWGWIGRSWDVLGNVVDVSAALNEDLSMSTADLMSEQFEYTFDRIGQFTPVLEIEKADGSKFNYYGETYTILEDQAPIAIAKLLNDEISVPLNTEVSFDSSESYDPKGDGIMSLLWDFGDGVTSSEIAPKHIYSMEGTFTPSLVVVSNDGKIGYAQTQSIKVLENIEGSSGLASRKILFQVADDGEVSEEVALDEDPEIIKESIQTMISEVIESFDSKDNEKPQIGPVALEPKSVEQGGALKLNAFVRDNVGLVNFGYVVISPEGKVVSHKAIDLINKNIKGEVSHEFYIEEKVDIPIDVTPGTYKIKLTATDTSGNQIAKITSNEEISATFEVKKSQSGIATYDLVVVPTEVFELTDENIKARASKTCSNVKGKASKRRCERKDKKNFNKIIKKDINLPELIKLADDYGLHIRRKDYLTTDKAQELESVVKSKVDLNKSANIKALTNFSVTSVSGVTNPWVYSGATSMNSLTLDVVPNSSSDGYFAIGTMGSLTSTYYSNWWKTNIYVDGTKVATIPWNTAAGISFVGTKQNVSVEFRPANNSGTSLNSATWTMSNFNFITPVKPEITTLSPTSRTAGRGSFDLYVNGNNFNASSLVYFSGNPITPYVTSSNLLVAKIPADYVKDSGSKTITVKNSDGQESLVKTFDVQVNPNDPCSIQMSLPQTHYGGDAWTILEGNNTYPSIPDAIIESSGSVSIPFCLDDLYDVKPTVNFTYTMISSSTNNTVTFWLDGQILGQTPFSTSQSILIDNLATKSLSASSHLLKISLSGGQGDRLGVGEVKFLNYSGPILDNFEPKNVGQEVANQEITIMGKNFNQNTLVVLDGVSLTKNSVTNIEIKATLPNKFSTSGQKTLYLSGNGKNSTALSLNVFNKPEIVSNSFMVNPIQPFPGTNFDLSLSVSDSLNESSNYNAELGVFDPDGMLVTIPNISNGLSTIRVDNLRNSNGTTPFSATVPLSVYAKQGNYKTVASVRRNSSLGTDFSSVDAFSYLSGIFLGLTVTDNVPSSHKLLFTPKPGIDVAVGIDENDVDNQGFNSSMTKVIQNDQEIKLKTIITQGQDQASMVKFNFISGDGRESGLIPADNYSFRYFNQNINSTTPVTFNTKIEVYWVDSGIQSKIRDILGPSILVYPNYKPVAKARVLKEQYPVFADKPPLTTAFIDAGSYDPNQRFSAALDSVNPNANVWDIYKITFGTDGMIYTQAASMLSSDRKTLDATFSERGSYFAKLTVSDKTGLSDSASTESVTVAGAGQRVGVFATTEPTDKKIYDRTSGSTDNGTIPVMFKSTVFGNYKSISYLWDFGDGACQSSSNPQTAYPECFVANPTHNYFDGKKSFSGAKFDSRKSITPKVKIKAMFGDGSSEEWEASAGTITFNAEPSFILLDLKPDESSGIIPFTVNLMIGPDTAKIVNATPTKYELDWGDGSEISQGTITNQQSALNELLSKTFTHTYTVPNTYSPKLTIFIQESSKTFSFYVPEIVAGASGVVGNDISTVQDGLTLEKEQGEILNLESEVLKSTSTLKPFRWRITDTVGNIYGEDDYNQYSQLNNIFIKYGLKDGNYKLSLSKDVDNFSVIDKTFNLNIKDSVKPEIESLEIISGNTIPQGGEVSFKIGAFDNSELMSINWYVKDGSGNNLFTGHKNISGYELKDIITFNLPDNISENDYSLVVEVNDKSNNIVSSLENFDLEISVIDKQYFLENLLEGSVTAGPGFSTGVAESFGLSGNPIGIGIAVATGIYNLAMLLNGSFDSSFPELQEDQIKDLSNDYKDTVNMSLCIEEGRLLGNLSMLSDLASLQNVYQASMFAYQESSKSQSLLKNFEEDLTNNPGSNFTELNTLASNITVCTNSNNKLEIKTGGDLTKNNPDCFYLPRLVQSTKNTLRMVTSQRANIGLSFLLNLSDNQALFSQSIADLILRKDGTTKQLKYGYQLLEKNFDTVSEVVRAFLNNEYGVSKVSDLSENNKNKVIPYIERLLQDIGSLNVVDGDLSAQENQVLTTITPSMSSNITISDFLYLKSLASKSRSTYLGIKSKKTLVSENRNNGFDSFVGSFIGVLSTGLQISTSYKDLISLYSKSNPEVVDILIQKNISEEAINLATKDSVNKVTRLISTLLPGDRRTNAINDLNQIVQKLRVYADSKTYKCNELKALEALLQSYKFISETLVVKTDSGALKNIRNKEDYVGVLNNIFVSRFNTIKNTIQDKAIQINNQDLASINTFIPRDLVHSILLNKNLTLEQKKQVISYAAILAGRAYKKAISNIDTFEHEFLDAKKNIGQVGRFIRRNLKEIESLSSNPKEVNKLIKQLKQNAKLKVVSGDDESYIFPFDDVLELTTNNKETEVVLAIKDQINKDLNPRKSSSLAGTGKLLIIIDKALAETKVQTRTVEKILRDVISANFANKVLEIDGKKVIIVISSQEDYIVKVEEVSNTISEDDSDDGESFSLLLDDLGRKNLISELQSLNDENVKSTIIQYQLLTEQELINPNTFFLGASKCVRGMSDSGSVESNPNISIPLSVSFDSTGKPTEINLSGKAEAFDTIQGLNGSLHIVYKATNEEILSIPLFKLEGNYTLGSVISIPATKLLGQELEDILSAITGFAAKKGITLKDILPKLSGYIALNGVKIAQGVKIITPAGVLLEGYIFNPQPSGENEPKVQVPPQALCLVDKLVAKPGEAVMISYSTIDANTVITNLQPGMTNQKAIKDDVITLNPTQDTTFTISASNSYGNDTAICMVFIDNAPAEIIGKADHQFFYGKDENNLDKSWKYPVLFNIMGSSTNNSSFNYSATFSGGEEFTPAVRVKPGTYNTSLIVNNIETIKTPDFILAPLESRIVQHMGGVFRSYNTKENLALIKQSMCLIGTSYIGDLKTSGVYLTDLNMNPTISNQPVIAKILRLIKTGEQAPNGSTITLENPKPCEENLLLGEPTIDNPFYLLKNGYIDLIIDSLKTNILNSLNSTVAVSNPERSQCLQRQYIYPLNLRPQDDFTCNYSLKFSNNEDRTFYIYSNE